MVLVDVEGFVHPRHSDPSVGTQVPPKSADSDRLKRAERNLVLSNQYSALSDDEMDSSSIPPDWSDETLHCPVELARLPSKLRGACPPFKTIQASRDCIARDAVDKLKIPAFSGFNILNKNSLNNKATRGVALLINNSYLFSEVQFAGCVWHWARLLLSATFIFHH